QHLQTFESEVDSSDTAVIESDYLQDVREDINEVYEELENEDESIHETIEDVSDITSATSPDFSDVNEWKKKSVEKIKELDEDLASFTSTGDETDVKEIMNKIETVMNNAKTSEGKARFADFKGASDNSDLKKLQDYNEDKLDEEFENARTTKESVLKDADESSKTIGNKAYTDLKNGKITEAKYNEIMSTLQTIEDELNEEVPQSFLEYVNENKVEFAKDTTISTVTGYTSKHGSMKLGGMINTFRGTKGDGFVMVNSKSNQYAQPFLNPKTHKWA